MKKRTIQRISLVLVLIMILSAVAGCAQLHPHSFGQEEIIKEPTCTEPGLKVGHCDCGKKLTTEIDPLGHGEGTWVTVKEATELEHGSKELRCERCGIVLATEVIPNQEPNKNELPPKDQEYTITILTQRHNDYGYFNQAEDLWFFRYIEHWFAQQGYTVDILIQQSNEIFQTKTLCLATDTLPDIAWGVELTNEEIVRYAMEEGWILEWTKYINTTLMPNLSKLFEEQPASERLCEAPNGGIYGLPYYQVAQYASGSYGLSANLYFRQSWLDAAGVQNPTTKEELLNVLRAFKTTITDQTAHPSDTPLVSVDGLFEKYLWTCLGFYGAEADRYGSHLMIKDRQLTIPAYTESYREFVTLMKTMYDEDLIAKDYFSCSAITARNLIKYNHCGALSWDSLDCVGDDFSDIICANPIPLGDVINVEDIHLSRQQTVNPNYIWANSRYEEPRILAMLIDFVYSEEGAWLYRCGPKQGEDPLGMVDGWYYDENGNVTTKLVADGTCASMAEYGRKYLYPYDNVGLCPTVVTSGTGKVLEFTDSVTGETYTRIDDVALSHDTRDGHWRLITIENWSERATDVRIPSLYLNADKMPDFLDRQNAIRIWIKSETTKFITGTRPLSEVEKFWEELEDLGIKEYLSMAQEGCADWMRQTFN